VAWSVFMADRLRFSYASMAKDDTDCWHPLNARKGEVTSVIGSAAIGGVSLSVWGTK
jgi:hypothetical protein